MTSSAYFAVLTLIGCATPAVTCAAEPPADMVYRNGFVYTVDEKDNVRQALAVRAGRILYVGDNAGANTLIGKATKVIDLHGRMLMPG
jgi:predicted amidohydrolase YtcJ